MKKIFLSIIIITCCVIYLADKLSSDLSKKNVRNAELDALIVSEPTPTPSVSEPLSLAAASTPVPSFSTPPPVLNTPIIEPDPDVMAESAGYAGPPTPPSGLAKCDTAMRNCRHKEIFFDYPSDRHPFSEEAEGSIVYCITDASNCDANRGINLISEEEEVEDLNYAQRIRDQVRAASQPVQQNTPCPYPLMPDGSCRNPSELNNEQSVQQNPYPDQGLPSSLLNPGTDPAQ